MTSAARKAGSSKGATITSSGRKGSNTASPKSCAKGTERDGFLSSRSVFSECACGNNSWWDGKCIKCGAPYNERDHYPPKHGDYGQHNKTKELMKNG